MMYLRRFLIEIIILFPFLYAYSQEISGTIVNEKRQSLEFANILLLTEDSCFIKGTVTDKNGVFIFKSIANGSLIKISSIGYTTLYKKLPCTSDTIILKDDNNMLNEVVIEKKIPKTFIKHDALTTIIQNTILSQVGSANDVLSQLPSIIKKGNGNWEVFGKGTPIIYINKRKIRDESELEQIDSNNIKAIDIVLNPGASYDASAKAIIRIETIKKEEGWNFNVRSGYYQGENADFIEQMNVNYRHHKLDISYMLRYDNLKSIQRGLITQEVFGTNNHWKQQNSLNSHTHEIKNKHTINFNYDFNNKHSIGGQYSINILPLNRSIANTKNEMWNNEIAYDLWNSHEKSKGSGISPSYQMNTYYRINTKKTNLNLDIDYYSNKEITINDEYENSDIQESRTFTANSQINNHLLALNLKLTHLTTKGNLNWGGEYVKLKRKDYYVSNSAYVETALSNIKENNWKIFVEYNHNFRHQQVTAGIRYEYINFEYIKSNKLTENQKRKYSDWYPYIIFNTQLKNIHLQLGYTIKVNRPTYRQLSNNIFYMNKFTMQSGNPTLESTTIHDISIACTWNFLQFTSSYQQEHNPIVFWNQQIGSNESVTLLNYNNLKTTKSLTSYLSISPQLGIWKPQISLGVRKQWLSINNLKFNHPTITISTNHYFQIPKNILLQIGLLYYGKGDYNNMQSEDRYNFNFTISKSLLNNSLKIDLRFNDICNKSGDAATLYTPNFRMYQKNSYDNREISLNFRFIFNNRKSKYNGSGAGKNEINRL